MKKFLPGLLILVLGYSANAQVYNNEWIDYSKTYYKFKLATNGLFRITQPTLNSYGLGSVNAQDFQLWRDGKEVPIYTSVATGPLGAGGYIQFYGTMNDGSLDRELYMTDDLQMNEFTSLLTDSSSYFLVVKAGANKRLVNTANNLTNPGTPEPSFQYTYRHSYNSFLYRGYSLNLGEQIFSSSFETAEGWAGDGIGPNAPFSENISNLYIHPSASTVQVNTTIAGYTLNSRDVTIAVNGIQTSSVTIDAFDIARTTVNVAASSFTGGNGTLTITNTGLPNDLIIIPQYKLTYLRSFNFGGAKSFTFDLPASNVSRFLEIDGFNYGTLPPVLYDLANQFAITTDVSTGKVRVKIPAVTQACKLVLSNVEAAEIKNISSFQTRNFVNYSVAGNQGDYVIISHPILFSGVNNVEQYRAYRSTADGGGYSSIIVDADQLVDQFAFGIRHHPLSIRNFASFALARFNPAPKYFFFVGKGLTYREFRTNEQSANINNLALVPTFGDPASDNLLTATRTTIVGRIPVGRLSAITGTEVANYLTKVKQFETAQRSTVQTVQAKAWTKNIAHLTGAIDEPYLSAYIESFMDIYDEEIKDSLFGGNVYRFSKNLGQNTAVGTNKTIDTLFNEGVSFITYFGHSSANNLEFNLDDPANYHNTGKYPVIMVNGCTTGDLFLYETLRAVSGGTLSEKYIFAPEKGSVGFIATTHFGLLSPLHTFSADFYKNMSTTMYGQPLGNIMRSTMSKIMTDFPDDFTVRIHAEEVTLHGDPALRMNTHARPDYITNDSLVTITPDFISLADVSYTVKAKILNIGRAMKDSINVRIQHQLPSGEIVLLANRRIKAPYYEHNIEEVININPLKDVGVNQIIVSIDVNNEVSELNEINNNLTKQFTILDDDIRPIFPYNYSIVNKPAVKLFGSTANPLRGMRQYVAEMDTTALFNSFSKITMNVSDSGGVIEFNPAVTLVDSTVYYWRIALGPVNGSTRWYTSSFRFINGSSEGYNQSHYFQFGKDEFQGISQDINSRRFIFKDVNNKLMIRSGLYPYYGWDQININVNDNGVDQYGCKYLSLQFVVYNPLTMKPWENYNVNGSGRFGSWTVCSGPRRFFEFPYNDPNYRKKAMDFIDSIPAGYYFSITNLGMSGNTTFINQWKADTTTLGSGKSLYHKLVQAGFTKIDSFYHNIPFIFIGKKGDMSFPPVNTVGSADNEQVVKTVLCPGRETDGYVTTPPLGPVKSWKRFKWDETIIDNTNQDIRSFDLIGISPTGAEEVLATYDVTKDNDISAISVDEYPYLRIRSRSNDETYATPTQLKYLILTADMIPEGGVSPNITFQFPGGVIQDSIFFTTGFKNASNVPFDSLKVHLILSDDHGNSTTFSPVNAVNEKLGPLPAYDSVILAFRIPSIYGANNTMRLDVNPDNNQPEVFHFNNVLTKGFTAITPKYYFTGSGNWNAVSNWLNRKMPPTYLPYGSEVYIDPATGNCSLNIPQTIGQGALIRVMAGKNLVVQGNLMISQ